MLMKCLTIYLLKLQMCFLKAPIPVLVNLIPKIKTNKNKQNYFTDYHYQ